MKNKILGALLRCLIIVSAFALVMLWIFSYLKWF